MTTLTRAEITNLTPPERLTLIGDLWDSIAHADVPSPLRSTASLSAVWPPLIVIRRSLWVGSK